MEQIVKLGYPQKKALLRQLQAPRHIGDLEVENFDFAGNPFHAEEGRRFIFDLEARGFIERERREVVGATGFRRSTQLTGRFMLSAAGVEELKRLDTRDEKFPPQVFGEGL
jgi:hypothetical protein